MTLIEDLLILYSVERRLRGLRSRVDSAETYLRVQQRQLNTLLERQEELETHKRQPVSYTHLTLPTNREV